MEDFWEHVLEIHPLLPSLREVVDCGAIGDADLSNKCFCAESEPEGLWEQADSVIVSTISACEDLRKECEGIEKSLIEFCGNLINRPEAEGGESKHSKRYTTRQVKILNKWFKRSPFPTPDDKSDITTLTNLTYSQVESWFNNKRKRAR